MPTTSRSTTRRWTATACDCQPRASRSASPRRPVTAPSRASRSHSAGTPITDTPAAACPRSSPPCTRYFSRGRSTAQPAWKPRASGAVAERRIAIASSTIPARSNTSSTSAPPPDARAAAHGRPAPATRAAARCRARTSSQQPAVAHSQQPHQQQPDQQLQVALHRGGRHFQTDRQQVLVQWRALKMGQHGPQPTDGLCRQPWREQPHFPVEVRTDQFLPPAQAGAGGRRGNAAGKPSAQPQLTERHLRAGGLFLQQRRHLHLRDPAAESLPPRQQLAGRRSEQQIVRAAIATGAALRNQAPCQGRLPHLSRTSQQHRRRPLQGRLDLSLNQAGNPIDHEIAPPPHRPSWEEITTVKWTQLASGLSPGTAPVAPDTAWKISMLLRYQRSDTDSHWGEEYGLLQSNERQFFTTTFP